METTLRVPSEAKRLFASSFFDASAPFFSDPIPSISILPFRTETLEKEAKILFAVADILGENSQSGASFPGDPIYLARGRSRAGSPSLVSTSALVLERLEAPVQACAVGETVGHFGFHARQQARSVGGALVQEEQYAVNDSKKHH